MSLCAYDQIDTQQLRNHTVTNAQRVTNIITTNISHHVNIFIAKMQRKTNIRDNVTKVTKMNPVTTQPSDAVAATVVQPTITADSHILRIAEHVLRLNDVPMHHTTLIAAIAAAGLTNDRVHTVNPKMWADERTNDDSPFHLYGKSVFGLKEWGNRFGTDTAIAAEYFRRSTSKVTAPVELTLDQIKAKREAMMAQIAEIDAMIAAADEAQTEAQTEA